MGTHDYVLNDAPGASFRADLNDALAAIVSQNSSATAPTTTYPYMFWADTGNALLKQRNAANSAWITLGSLGSANLGLFPLAGGTLSGALNTARATVASHATTADIWGAAGNQINWTGTATTTIFPNAPQAGSERTLVAAGACAFTAGANMLIDGVASAATITLQAGDIVRVLAISTTQFRLNITKYDGTSVASSNSLGSNGYQKFPGGLIIQWGITGSVSAGGSATVTFPVAFPNAYLGHIAIITGSSTTTTPSSAGAGAISSSQMIVYNWSAATASSGIRWFAFGY